MDNRHCIELLNSALDGTVNSVVQYFAISAAYVPPGFEEQMETMERIRQEEAQMAHDLNGALHELDGAPKVGVFPYWNVDLNYLDARFMARFAARHQEGVVAALEEGLEGARDHAKAHRLLSEILEQKRAHLEQLREISGEGEEVASEEAPAAEPAGESSAQDA